ncbi:hypothetical protein BBC27_08105 [Acidithiobacillus ferrivorans]|uniref:Uncharacterized protein n=1 Tax=Acidithiobacillus ferrivorans TaxID=160808 RepID=A0A1B9C0C4_9PROT|nr:hypothetical protein [Acidithiobacillus ferrivorans]OCB03419.1 hypothetical protein BBC27_08105 [Acidithiobacillus ferrivorans]
MSMGMQLFDQRTMQFRGLDSEDHAELEAQTLALIEKLIGKYREEIRQPARIFIAWISGVRRDQPRTEAEAKMLADMVQRRESAILPSNMEALRVYADIVKIGAAVAEARIKMIEERTSKPFKVISNHLPSTPQNDDRKGKAEIRRVV